jgi:hypothetical protein
LRAGQLARQRADPEPLRGAHRERR